MLGGSVRAERRRRRPRGVLDDDLAVVGDSWATGTDIVACGGLMEGKKQARFCALGGVRRSWVEQLVSIRWVGLVLSKSYIIERI
jgi:hypothetical protein